MSIRSIEARIGSAVDSIAHDVSHWGPREVQKEFRLEDIPVETVISPLRERLGIKYLVCTGYTGLAVKRRWR